MIFHENCLLADNSYEISYFIFFRKLKKMSQNLSSAAVVIGALWVNTSVSNKHPFIVLLSCRNDQFPGY